MKKSRIAVLLALVLLFVGVGLAYADETGWEDVKDNPIPAEQEMASYPLLRQIMDGAFDEDEDVEQTQILADALPLLAALPAEDLASFAAAYGLPVESVTESYYEALVSTLRANIALNPNESDEAQKTLKLLLSGDDENADDAVAVTPEALAQALASYQLPAGFADYLQNQDADDEGVNQDEDQQDADIEDENDADAGDKDDADIEDGDDKDTGDKDDADIEEGDDKDTGDKDDADIQDDDDKDTGDKDDADIQEDDDKDAGDKNDADIEDDADKDDSGKDSGSHHDGGDHDDDGDQGDREDNDD